VFIVEKSPRRVVGKVTESLFLRLSVEPVFGYILNSHINLEQLNATNEFVLNKIRLIISTQWFLAFA